MNGELRNMPPSLSNQDGSDRTPGNAELQRNLAETTSSRRQYSNSADLLSRELRVDMSLSTRQTLRIQARRIPISHCRAPFRHHVGGVLSLRSHPEMGRVDAVTPIPIGAIVQDFQAVWDFTMCQLPSMAVGQHSVPLAVEVPVSVTLLRPLPDPTPRGTGTVSLSPELNISKLLPTFPIVKLAAAVGDLCGSASECDPADKAKAFDVRIATHWKPTPFNVGGRQLALRGPNFVPNFTIIGDPHGLMPDNWIDVLVNSQAEAIDFGRQELCVEVWR